VRLNIIYFIVFAVFMVGCDTLKAESIMKGRQDTQFNSSDYLGNIPYKFIHAAKKFEDGKYVAHIELKSEDIPEYQGVDFTVSLILETDTKNKKKNNAGQYFIEEVLPRRYNKSEFPEEKQTIGKLGSYIGLNRLDINRLVSSTGSIEDLIIINQQDIVVFREAYPPNKERMRNGIAIYDTTVKGKAAASYRINYHYNDELTHEKFIYVKTLIDNFYN
jgi:hypothetical protein